jgi:DNA polymerase III gamma/tau subunit
VAVKPLTSVEMTGLLDFVSSKEGIELKDPVRNCIASVSEGSSRKALVLLEQVSHLEDEQAQLEAIHNTDERKKAIDLCRLLMNPRTKWKEVSSMIQSIEELDPESFRWMMLSYASSVCLGESKLANRAFVILDQFATNYFDTKKAGLIADCWTVVNGRSDE